MPRPIDRPPASWQPRFTASIDAGTAARDDRPSGLGQRLPDPVSHRVVRRIAGGAGGAEDRDRARHLRQQAETLDELALDAKHAPRVGVDPVGDAARVQQPLIGRGRLDLRAAKQDRAAAALRPGGRTVGIDGRLGHGPTLGRDRPVSLPAG